MTEKETMDEFKNFAPKLYKMLAQEVRQQTAREVIEKIPTELLGKKWKGDFGFIAELDELKQQLRKKFNIE